MRSAKEILEDLANGQKEYKKALESLTKDFYDEQKKLRKELEEALEAGEEQEKEQKKQRAEEQKALKKAEKQKKEEAEKAERKRKEEEIKAAKIKEQEEKAERKRIEQEEREARKQQEAEERARLEEEERARIDAEEESKKDNMELCADCEEYNPKGYEYCEHCGAAKPRPRTVSKPVSPRKASAPPPRKVSTPPPKISTPAQEPVKSAVTPLKSAEKAKRRLSVSSAPKSPVCEENPNQQIVYERLQQRAATEETTATEASNKKYNKSPKIAIEALSQNNPDYDVLDLSSNTVFSMKHKEYCEMLGEGLKTNTHVRQVKLSKCALLSDDAKAIAEALAANDAVEVLHLDSNKISNDGATAIAEALKSNTRLEELNLLGQPHQFGDACLESFIQMFDYNVTLTKIIWRLDSRKSFAINKLIVRNNTIKKWLAEGKDVSSLIPSHCNIPEFQSTSEDVARKARAQSSAPPVKPAQKKEASQQQEQEEQPEEEQEEVVAEEPEEEDVAEHFEEEEPEPVEEEIVEEEGVEGEAEGEAEVEEEEEEEEPLPAPEDEEEGVQVINDPDVWWTIEPTPNGDILDDGRTLEHSGAENGGKACIGIGNVGFDGGVREFSVCSTGKPAVLVGVCIGNEIDQTDASKNKNRFVCAFFNGKIFGLEGSQPHLDASTPIEEIAIKLDLDERAIYFAANGADFEEPAFSDLPEGVYFPYFSLGNGCSITCI